jgi:hypothetical protein
MASSRLLPSGQLQSELLGADRPADDRVAVVSGDRQPGAHRFVHELLEIHDVLLPWDRLDCQPTHGDAHP